MNLDLSGGPKTLRELGVKAGDKVWFAGWAGNTAPPQEMTVRLSAYGDGLVAGDDGWFDHIKAFYLLEPKPPRKGFAAWVKQSEVRMT